YLETSPVVSNTPNAPEPLACGWRSITFSRLKCASCSTRCTSCSRIGPSGPTDRELRSLGAGAPAPVVEAALGSIFIFFSFFCSSRPVWAFPGRAELTPGGRTDPWVEPVRRHPAALWAGGPLVAHNGR